MVVRCEGRSGDLDVRFGGPWWGQEPRQGGLRRSSRGVLEKRERATGRSWRGVAARAFVCVFTVEEMMAVLPLLRVVWWGRRNE